MVMTGSGTISVAERETETKNIPYSSVLSRLMCFFVLKKPSKVPYKSQHSTLCMYNNTFHVMMVMMMVNITFTIIIAVIIPLICDLTAGIM